MSGDTRDGKCAECGKRRHEHIADEEGLKLVCPFGESTFKWAQTAGRVSTSFTRMEAKIMDILVAQAMGASAGVSRTHPDLPSLRRKTMALRKRSEEDQDDD